MKDPISILGIGAPTLDYILKVSESFLETIPGPKTGMQPIELQTLLDILERAEEKAVLLPGGSACNALKGLVHLGWSCGLVGMLGKDPAGAFLKQQLEKEGIHLFLQESETPTSQVLVLVAPDGNRTFRTFTGAGLEIRPDQLNPLHFKDVKLVHVEGYGLPNRGYTEHAMAVAKMAGAQVSFDLASFEIVEVFRETILALLKEFVDIVFLNEKELYALLQLSPEEGCDALRSLCKTNVVLMGDSGCWVSNQKSKIFCPAYPVVPLDTTGAGDLFASGFLHGYLRNKPIEECARYGAMLGAAVVQVHGTHLPADVWDHLNFK